jgi:hypothetical protein
MFKTSRCLVLPFLAFATLSACEVRVKSGHFDEDRILALAGVAKYRGLYEKRDYERLYDLSSSALKAAVPKEQFASAVQSAMAQYGNYKSSALVGSSCFPNEVRLVYDTEYERAKVRELMTWSVTGSQAELTTYQVLPSQGEFHKESQVGCPVP